MLTLLCWPNTHLNHQTTLIVRRRYAVLLHHLHFLVLARLVITLLHLVIDGSRVEGALVLLLLISV